MIQQIPLLFYAIAIFGILAVVIGNFIAPLLLKFHYKIIGKKLNYGIQELTKSDNFKRRFYAFLPALMAVSLSMIFADNETVINTIVSQEVFAQGGTIEGSFLLAFIILLPLTSFISLMFFAPVWVLLESGIIYSNRQKVIGKMRSEEIDGIGSWYYKFVKGYVGIGAAFTYIGFIIEALQTFDSSKSIFESGAFVAMIMLPTVPFLLMLFFSPAMIIFDKIIDKKRQRLIVIAKNFGINKDLNELIK
jgi:hypothetical protein